MYGTKSFGFIYLCFHLLKTCSLKHFLRVFYTYLLFWVFVSNKISSSSRRLGFIKSVPVFIISSVALQKLLLIDHSNVFQFTLLFYSVTAFLTFFHILMFFFISKGVYQSVLLLNLDSDGYLLLITFWYCHESVSYTHLDVYKRQYVFGLANTFNA